MRRILVAFGLLVVAGVLSLRAGRNATEASAANPIQVPDPNVPRFRPDVPTPHSLQALYGQLPLIFEPNRGQSDAHVKFLARGRGYGVFLTANEALVALQHSAVSTEHSAGRSLIRMALVGASAGTSVEGVSELPGKSHYFIGNDPAKWHRNVPQFARVRYGEVYPGIDLVYYGNQGQLEYDFEVRPGADPRRVTLRFDAPAKLALDGRGNLVLALDRGSVSLNAPRIYQQIGEERRAVNGNFVLLADNEVGFEIGAYDRSRTLIIDPVLSFSTYLGGSGAEVLPSITVDSGGSTYITGSTTSTNLPGASNTLNGSGPDVFVTKLNSTGSAVVFSTYLGGSGTDASAGVKIDSGFNVVIAGNTDSTDFPTANAFQTAPASGSHVFVTKLQSDGSASPLYSTYLFGNGTDTATGVAVDTHNKIYVTGTTTSTNFPTTPEAFQTTRLGDQQFFLTKIDPATSGAQSLVYSTYFGGGIPSSGTTIGGGVAVDGSNNAYITGETNFQHTGSNATLDFPILNAYQGTLNCPAGASGCTNTTATDIFVAKINTAGAVGTQLVYSTYLGGGGDDGGRGIALDSSGNAYITGATGSTDITFPSGITPFQRCLNDPASASGCTGAAGASDAFVAKLNNPSSAAVSQTYFSYLGGTGNDTGAAIALDSVQAAWITGSTSSSDFHLQNATQTSPGGGTSDAFVARVDTTSTGHFSTYLGGGAADQGTGIAVDALGNVYAAGETASGDFPHIGGLTPGLSGASDAFVSKYGAAIALTVEASPKLADDKKVGIGNQVTFSFKITNTGDLATGITFQDVLQGLAANFVSASSSPGSCGSPTGNPSTVTCSVGTLNKNATATVTVVLTPTAAGSLGNVGTVQASGSAQSFSDSATVTVLDFILDATPDSQTTPAGTPVSYQIKVEPSAGEFPNSISLSCSAGLPPSSSCEVTNNPISKLESGGETRSLTVNTTARTTTSMKLRDGGFFYAAWLPVSGLAFLGLGIGTGMTRKRRALMGLLLGGFLALVLLQPGCGSDSQPPPQTSGTPAGNYTITVSGTSGSASHSDTIQLTVQ